ncbi:uncharacterized protein LOC105431028 [Pogonomyrmex barbatus]|uniref:Uncharacterized protein LOC105431028 n=1 Tax=Pogonomyrmex barbatus TaxID=144034 RepID=A0A6I9XDU6_9HYME|nr:uncharacterized protein LOC105431028 [Pogonomyrmex barbatus]
MILPTLDNPHFTCRGDLRSSDFLAHFSSTIHSKCVEIAIYKVSSSSSAPGRSEEREIPRTREASDSRDVASGKQRWNGVSLSQRSGGIFLTRIRSARIKSESRADTDAVV